MHCQEGRRIHAVVGHEHRPEVDDQGHHTGEEQGQGEGEDHQRLTALPIDLHLERYSELRAVALAEMARSNGTTMPIGVCR